MTDSSFIRSLDKPKNLIKLGICTWVEWKNCHHRFSNFCSDLSRSLAYFCL